MPVVEFLGLPGSGKSTLAAALIDTLPGTRSLDEAVREALAGASGDRVTRLAARFTRRPSGRLMGAAYARSSDRLPALVRFASRHPETIRSVLAAQSARKERDLQPDVVLGWVLNLMVRYQLATEGGGQGWLVIDEGFAQRAVALFAGGWSPEDEGLLRSYAEAVPRPDLLVVVETPPEVCASRLDERGWSERLAGADESQRRAFLNAAGSVAGVVVDTWASAGQRIVRVSGVAPTPESTAAIAATLSDAPGGSAQTD